MDVIIYAVIGVGLLVTGLLLGRNSRKANEIVDKIVDAAKKS